MKPTVVHLLPTFDMGGLGSLAFTMIRAWPEEARHIVIAPKYPDTKPVLFNDFAKLVTQGNVAQVPRAMQALPTMYRDALAAQLRKMQVGHNVTHAINYNFTDHVWNSAAFRRCGYPDLPFICHVGTVLPDSKNTRLMCRSPFAYATKFVPASSAVRAQLLHLGTWPERIHSVIWNGHASAGERTERSIGPFRFGFTGRMAYPAVKDWKTLFNGLALCKAPVEMHIAGDGPMRAELETMAKASGKHVVFHGLLQPSKIPAFLKSIDCFVMAALPIEGFSMALVEAIVEGCFVLGTDVPSVRELLQAEGGNGEFLADSDEAMGEAMTLMASSSAFRALNQQVMNRLKPRLTANRMAHEYWSIK